MNKYVYHGSPKENIKMFVPLQATQKGRYVYATENYELAGIFGFQMSSLERTMFFVGEKLYVVERLKDYFKRHD